jgi:hypothetical protein
LYDIKSKQHEAIIVFLFMEEKKKRLLQLIEELKFPLLPEESRQHTEQLSEEELDELISAYQAVMDYRQGINEAARFADPEGYGKVQNEYNEKLQRLDLDFAGEMENLQSEDDNEREKIENEAEQEISKTVNDYLDEARQVEEASIELASKIVLSAMTEN